MNDNQGEIKVTGTRDFSTGAHRDPNDDKGRYDLISPIFMRRLAIHTQKGGQTRGDRNWESGMPLSAVIDSAIRHLYAFVEGDRSEDHLAAGAWNIMVAIHCGELIMKRILPEELYDLPDYTERTEADNAVAYCPNHGDHPAIDGCPRCKKEWEEHEKDILEKYWPESITIEGKPIAEEEPYVDHCGNCKHSDNGSPIPFSDECGTCSRTGKWEKASDWKVAE